MTGSIQSIKPVQKTVECLISSQFVAAFSGYVIRIIPETFDGSVNGKESTIRLQPSKYLTVDDRAILAPGGLDDAINEFLDYYSEICNIDLAKVGADFTVKLVQH